MFSSSQSSEISGTAPSLSSKLGNALRHQTDRDLKSEQERIMLNAVMLYYSYPLIHLSLGKGYCKRKTLLQKLVRSQSDSQWILCIAKEMGLLSCLQRELSFKSCINHVTSM